jgi:hypothetical protein
MEFASRVRWIVLVTIFVIALILIGWGLFSIASNLFSSNDTAITQTDPSTDFLVESTKVAKYSVDGPIVANENHRSYTITVTESQVIMKTYKSYGQIELGQKSYPNTAAAYSAFLSALTNANVTAMKRNATTDASFSDKGVCATGRKFILDLDSSLSRWSTSCDTKQGNAGSNMGRVGNLFQRQVPDFGQLASGLGI